MLELKSLSDLIRAKLMRSDFMRGKLFLSGGGDEKETFEIDEVFMKGVNRILYIPVAWKNNDFASCLTWFPNAMSIHKKVEIKNACQFE